VHRPKSSLAGFALLMLLGGCVHQRAAAPEAESGAIPSSATRASAPPVTPPSANAPAVESQPQSAVPAASDAANLSTVPPKDAASLPAASSKPSAAAPTSRRQGSPAAAVSGSKPLAQTAQATAALDLASLEQRLRDTHAIGVFTKLSLKNQVDDLLAQFKSFHRGQTPPTLTQLRQQFELLLMKVVTVLQDGDAALASEVSSSREALWSVLSDPQKFAQI
jgi:hypothetical protein